MYLSLLSLNESISKDLKLSQTTQPIPVNPQNHKVKNVFWGTKFWDYLLQGVF